nr:signal peptidase I [Agrilactobacillus fermenti]
MVLALIFFGIGQALKTWVFANEQVEGPSMQSTFQSGDRIIAFRHAKVERGDVVILKAPDEPDTYYIKRVIGLPGETVASRNDVMYINGKKLKEPYLDRKLSTGPLYTTNFSLKTLNLPKTTKDGRVPKNNYFVMGDHRDVSKDSRMIGFIPKSSIIGIVKWRYWPLNEMKTY